MDRRDDIRARAQPLATAEFERGAKTGKNERSSGPFGSWNHPASEMEKMKTLHRGPDRLLVFAPVRIPVASVHYTAKTKMIGSGINISLAACAHHVPRAILIGA